MWADFSLKFNPSDWQTWVIPVAGIAVAVVTVSLGSMFMRGRKQAAPPPPKEAPKDADPFLEGSANERRTVPRRGGGETKILITDAEAKAKPFEALVVNRSMGGLGLITNMAFNKGTIISVRAASAPETYGWIQLQVRRCNPIAGSRWEIGCQFIRPPSWAVLLTFG